MAEATIQKEEFDTTATTNVEATAIPSIPKPKPEPEVEEATRAALFKREMPFDFMEERESPQFDLLSYKESEREVENIVYDFNRGVYNNMKTVDSLGANEYISKNSFGYQALKDNPDLYNEIKAQGAIGWGETWDRMDKWGIVPYAGDVSEIMGDVHIFQLIQKNNKGVSLTSEEEKELNAFAWDMIEMDIRGQSLGGKFLQGVYRAPAFVLEFITAGGILKQVGKTVALKGTKKFIAKGMRKYLKGRLAKGVVKMGVEGTARSFLNPISWRKNYVQRRLHDSIAITDKGEMLFKEAKEAPAMTFVKSFGDVWVEMASETAGGYLLKPIGKRITAKLPAGIKGAFSKFVKKETGKSAKGLTRMIGFDGLVEEMGEERIGDFLRVTLNLDPEEGYSFDQYGQALFPDWEDLLVEAGVIATHGTMSRSMVSLYNKVQKDNNITDKVELARILSEVDSLSEVQRQNLLDDVVARETEAEKVEYDKAIEGYRIAIERAGVPKAEAEKAATLWDAFATVSVSKLRERGVEMTRSQWLIENAPRITAAERGKGLAQRAKIYHSTDEVFEDFDVKKSADGTIWFSDNREKLEKGEVAATGKSIIMERIVDTNKLKLGGWAETDKYSTDELISMGYDGLKLEDEGEVTYQIFHPEKLELPKELAQERRGAYDPVKNLIALLPTADRSTILHESAHAFFEYYLKNFPEDLKAVFDWTGIKQKPLNELSDNEYRRLQEAFARGFETYIMEGKAPSSKLAEVFNAFREWLIDIYNTVTGLNIKLSDDVRQLYKDMLDVEADVDVVIDTTITPELKGKALTLYQEAKQKLEDLKKQRKSIVKKYGQKAKANLAEVDQAIKDLETMALGIRRKSIVDEAEAVYEELPVSEVIENKIRLSLEYEGMMNRYGVPANVKTTKRTAKTVDEWADDLGMEEEALLEEVAKVRSKSHFVDTYVAEEIKQLKKERIDEAEIKQKMDTVLEKLKEDAQKGAITELQHEVISTIREMNISNADKVKFLGKVQQAKTHYSQRKVLMEMNYMEQKYWEKQQRTILDARIQKLLKRTKPIKLKGYEKGKFDYASNIFFNELKEINKSTQEQALEKVEAFQTLPPTDIMSNREILIRAFTSYKAYGKSKGSLELFESVHDQLQRAVADARSDAAERDFEDKLERREKIKKFLTGVNKTRYKGDSKSLTTKILNVYRTGSLMSGANMWSLINSVAGKEIADELNLEHPELTRDTRIFNDIKDTLQQAVEILELKSETDFFKLIDKYNSEEHQLVELDPRYEEEYIVRDFNRMGIIDVYNAIKNEKTKNNYYRVYGQKAVTELVAKLSEKEKLFADMLMEKAQEKRDEINKKHIETTGMDLGFVENYWPGTSVKPQGVVNDNLVNEVILATFQKERAKGAVTPIPVDAWRKISSHIAGQNHVLDVISEWRNTRKILDSETVKNKIERKYGKDVYRTLITQVNALSLTGLRNQSDVINSITARAFKNWIKAKIALNPSVFVKQLISVVNYTENIPVNEWMKYFFEGMVHPKKTLDFMMKEAPYLGARYARGYSEDINKALSEGKKLAKAKSMNKVLTSLVRMGDIGAIVYGGYPMVRYLEVKKGLSRKEAIKQFELATIRSQQSGLAASLDLAQQSKNPFVNFFFAFKNTPKQYMRKITDAWIMYYNGDITATELAKTLTIYMLVQPALFGAVTQAMRSLLYDDDDEYLDDVAGNILTSYTNAFPIIGEINRNLVQTIIADITGGKRPWKMFNQPMISDIERMRSNVLKAMEKEADELTIFDLLGIMGTPIELAVGFPIQTLERPFKKRMVKTEKKTKL